MSELSIQELEPAGSKELAYRENDGISVALLWHSQGDAEGDKLSVVVQDFRQELTLELPATPENCMSVFNHPFAYKSAGELALERAQEAA
jgi:hypothetical protein